MSTPIALAIALLAASTEASGIKTVDFAQGMQSPSDQATESPDSTRLIDPAPAQRSLSEAELPTSIPAQTRSQFKQGSALKTAGSVISWGGVAMMAPFALSVLSNSPTSKSSAKVAGIGLLLFETGLGVQAAGCARMSSAVHAADPSEPDGFQHWGTYRIGWGLYAAGATLFTIAAVSDNSNDADAATVVGALAVFGGPIFHAVSMKQFQKGSGILRRKWERLDPSVTMGPILVPTSHGVQPGLGLAGRF